MGRREGGVYHDCENLVMGFVWLCWGEAWVVWSGDLVVFCLKLKLWKFPWRILDARDARTTIRLGSPATIPKVNNAG